jgi:hypothetical protein
LINILRSQYNEFYQITKKRLIISNGIIILAILLKIGWIMYFTGIYILGIMYVVNQCLLYTISYIFPSIAMIIKLWMAVNNMR